MQTLIFQIFKIPIFEKEITEFFTGLVNEVIKTREEQNVIRPDLIHLLLEARKGNHKHEETTSVETGYATVKESDHGKGTYFILNKYSIGVLSPLSLMS